MFPRPFSLEEQSLRVSPQELWANWAQGLYKHSEIGQGAEILESTYCPCPSLLFIFRRDSNVLILLSLPQFEEARIKCQWMTCNKNPYNLPSRKGAWEAKIMQVIWECFLGCPCHAWDGNADGIRLTLGPSIPCSSGSSLSLFTATPEHSLSRHRGHVVFLGFTVAHELIFHSPGQPLVRCLSPGLCPRHNPTHSHHLLGLARTNQLLRI